MSNQQLRELDNQDAPQSTEALEEILSVPTDEVIEMFGRLSGHLVMLGVGGKMGPTMVRMAQRAIQQSGSSLQLTAISRFSSRQTRARLEAWGVTTHSCDLLDPVAVKSLPDASYVVNLSGFKFGAADNLALTWATNCEIPSAICRKYSSSQIVAFSTGNVYGMVDVQSGGSLENAELNPSGEYAMAALGRERIYEYYAKTFNRPVAIVRLNYATELRYGVLIDIASKVLAGETISLVMGYLNAVWLGDANAMTLRCLELTETPARTINMTGPDVISVRHTAERIAELTGKDVAFDGTELETALLSRAAHNYPEFGAPHLTLETMIRWSVQWLQQGGELLGKPTKFQVTDGKF
ncbi:MAG: epimerase [Planctomycetaceae bacterium]|nr:epimerase [Planctomycetaceae bacterium]|tara:strand:+ start:4219 stop:5277 length:1059 start_codon:yes stop_codon:yes gene_type:complete